MAVYITDWLGCRDLRSHRTELTADTELELDQFMRAVMKQVHETATSHGEEVNAAMYRWDPVTWCFLVDNTAASFAATAGARLLGASEMGRYMAERAQLQRGLSDEPPECAISAISAEIAPAHIAHSAKPQVTSPENS